MTNRTPHNWPTPIRKAILLTAASMLAITVMAIPLVPQGAANASPTHHATHSKVHKAHKAYLPKCKEEDSDNCIWNAHTSGNGEGVSFIAWHGQVYYLDECAGEAIPNSCDPDSNN